MKSQHKEKIFKILLYLVCFCEQVKIIQKGTKLMLFFNISKYRKRKEKNNESERIYDLESI